MNLIEEFKNIKAFVFDMDGVLTDGTLLISSGTEWLRKMHIRDGHALKLAVDQGYKVAVISGSNSEPVRKRLRILGVKDVYMQVENKKERLEKYMKKHSLDASRVIYMGDDMPDYYCMQMAGIGAMPADGAHDLLAVAKYVSPFKGGEGCVRDVIEKVLKLNGHWHY